MLVFQEKHYVDARDTMLAATLRTDALDDGWLVNVWNLGITMYNYDAMEAANE